MAMASFYTGRSVTPNSVTMHAQTFVIAIFQQVAGDVPSGTFGRLSVLLGFVSMSFG